MGEPQAKYAIIRIPIGLNTEDTGKNTKLYFTAEDNNTPLKEQADALRAEEVPLEVNKTVNTSLFVYIILGLLILVVSFLTAWIVPLLISNITWDLKTVLRVI